MTAAPSEVVGQSGRGQQILQPRFLLKGVPVVEAVVAYCPVKKKHKKEKVNKYYSENFQRHHK